MSKIIQIADFFSSDLDIYARMSENQLRHIYSLNVAAASAVAFWQLCNSGK